MPVNAALDRGRNLVVHSPRAAGFKVAETHMGQDRTQTLDTPFAVEPCRVLRPAVWEAPFVFASPHSGRIYPQSLLAESRLSPLALRRSEDAYVEELFAGVVDTGAPLLAACFPRVLVDVNRAPSELDPAMFDGPLALGTDLASVRVSAGLGVIPRVVREGVEIYRGKLASGEAQWRLRTFHEPYHAALSGLVSEALARFGAAIVVDCHSMPSAANIPDIVLGDRYGSSASAGLVHQAETAFREAGFSVARNTPYAGGYTTWLYGRRDAAVQALQIEINRALYLDEERVEKLAAFAALRTRIGAVLAKLMAGSGKRRHPPLAAE